MASRLLLLPRRELPPRWCAARDDSDSPAASARLRAHMCLRASRGGPEAPVVLESP